MHQPERYKKYATCIATTTTPPPPQKKRRVKITRTPAKNGKVLKRSAAKLEILIFRNKFKVR
jgi:hypothetical protein